MTRDNIFLAAALMEALDDYPRVLDQAKEMNTGGVHLRVSVYEQQGDGDVTHAEMLVPIGFGLLHLLPGIKEKIEARLMDIGVDFASA